MVGIRYGRVGCLGQVCEIIQTHTRACGCSTSFMFACQIVNSPDRMPSTLAARAVPQRRDPGQCRIRTMWSIIAMLWFMFAMIQSEPTITSSTINTPNATAIALLTLSELLVMWIKKTR